MTGRAGIWAGAIAASVLVHAGAGLALFAALRPDPVTEQPMPHSALDVAAYALDRTKALEQRPDAETAREGRASADGLTPGAIPQSRAQALDDLAGQRVLASAATGDRARQAPSDATAALVAQPAVPAAMAPDVRTDPAVAAEASMAAAAEASPESIAAQSARPGATELSASAPAADPLPQSPARADTVTRPAGAPATALTQSTPDLQTQPPVSPKTERSAAASLPMQTATTPRARPENASALAARPAVAKRLAPAADALTLTLAVVAPAAPARPAIAVATARPAAPPSAAVVKTAALAAPPAPARPTALAQSAPQAPAASESIPDAVAASASRPLGAKVKAMLAFPGGDGDVDPISLAAFQSFMEPGDLTTQGDPLRDGIAAVLAQVPCSRLQVSFQPDTATLEVKGHIPEDGLRGPVLNALRAQIGGDIGVSDNIRILGRPQCSALAGIADAGLPQSTDQDTNPLLIGENTHASELSFKGGDLLTFDLESPDYDAYFYVDYFDADGNVLHLAPNEIVTTRLVPAQSNLRIGELEDDAATSTLGAAAEADMVQFGGLKIYIGPPYGQEITVAFAASRPLYDGLRPIQEPALPYLNWLKAQIARARADDPDFKGEWVYFFVATSAQ